MRVTAASSLAVVVAVLTASPGWGQGEEHRTVDQATTVLQEIMSIPNRSIPATLLADAQGVAIIPSVVKLGFVVGGRFGRGVVLVRHENGWSPPTFVTLTGGSVGWQAGVQATDVILVFRTRKSVDGLLRGKFTIGADAAVAAGPVGRQAAAATDATLRAEILSYSRSRGLFAGVALDGSVIQVDVAANGAYYQNYGAGTPALPTAEVAQVPASAARLMAQLARYTSGAVVSSAGWLNETPRSEGFPVEGIRRRLVEESTRLQQLVDADWRLYLALPAELYETAGRPDPAVLRSKLQQYDRLLSERQYDALTQRPEFQATHRALREYVESQAGGSPAALELPPPPQ